MELGRDLGIVGLAALRNERSRQESRSITTAPIDGLRALDRYTLQFEFDEPRPRFLSTIAGSDLYGALAREVVEFYGDRSSSTRWAPARSG